MPRFDRVPDEGTPAHILVLGTTKTGKSDWVAHAILDGFYCLYFDSDNGGNTLKKEIPVGHEARKRLFYVQTKNPYSILKGFTENGIFRWNTTKDKEFLGRIEHDDEDEIFELRPSRIPRGFIVCFDGWTGISIDCMRVSAKANGTSLTDMATAKQNVKRAIYQDANVRLNSALDILQSIRPHLIIQAHGQFYERKEKPVGVNDAKEDEMIIKENILIPVSCSQPHGHGMGKFFNEIAWTEIDRSGGRVLDFDVKMDRIGGGSITGRGNPRTDYSFRNLFQKEPTQFNEEEIEGFYREFLAKDYVAPNSAASKPSVSPAAPTGNLPPAGTPASVSAGSSTTKNLSLLLKK